MTGMDGLKKMLAVGSFATATALNPVSVQSEEAQSAKVEAVQKVREIASSRIINQTGNPTFLSMFQDQLQLMAQTKAGSAVLAELPSNVNFIIKEAPEYAEEAGFWDGENCTIYDDTLLSGASGAAILMTHEGRHAIQGEHYAKDYGQMPTEQQIAYNKMIEIETRLQDALMKEELYQKKVPGTRSYEFATADWMDYRRLKANIQKENPTLSADQIDRMARTQFVTDSWQGNHKREIYDQRDGVRTFRDWTKIYNEKSLQQANRRCMLIRPLPDMTVDESKVERHHDIMQEFIQRMGIDVSPDYFDTLKHDKSLHVVRDPQELAAVGKHLGHDLKLVVMPRDDFVRVGGIAVAKDNSTVMFNPEQRKVFEKEIQAISMARGVQQAQR